MKEDAKKTLFLIILVILGGVMFLGFANIYEEIIKSDIVGVLTLFSIPAVIGALIIKSKYENVGEGLLASTALLFIGLLLERGIKSFQQYPNFTNIVVVFSGLSLLLGALIFVCCLLYLLYVLVKE